MLETNKKGMRTVSLVEIAHGDDPLLGKVTTLDAADVHEAQLDSCTVREEDADLPVIGCPLYLHSFEKCECADAINVQGHTISLPRIEAAARLCPSVRSAAAVVHEHELVQTLILYVTPFSADVVDITRALNGALPAPMLPHHTISRTNFPRALNGSIDRLELQSESPPAPQPRLLHSALCTHCEPNAEAEAESGGRRGRVDHDRPGETGDHSSLLWEGAEPPGPLISSHRKVVLPPAREFRPQPQYMPSALGPLEEARAPRADGGSDDEVH